MPEDLKVSQIGSSPLPPPFRGLHPPWVRKHCQIIFGCYFRKSSIPYNSVRKLMLTFLTSICDPLQCRTVCLEHKKRWFSIWDSFSLDFINWCALQNLVKKIRHFAWRTTGETRASCQLETDTGIKCALDSYYLENWWNTCELPARNRYRYKMRARQLLPWKLVNHRFMRLANCATHIRTKNGGESWEAILSDKITHFVQNVPVNLSKDWMAWVSTSWHANSKANNCIKRPAHQTFHLECSRESCLARDVWPSPSVVPVL